MSDAATKAKEELAPRTTEDGNALMYEGDGFYRHYKGEEYEVLGLGMEEATLAPVVVYKPTNVDQVRRMNLLFDDGVLFWTRPLDDFNAEVDGKPRFERTR